MSHRIRTGAVCSAACGTGSLCKGGDGSVGGEGAQVRIRLPWNFLTGAETTAGRTRDWRLGRCHLRRASVSP